MCASDVFLVLLSSTCVCTKEDVYPDNSKPNYHKLSLKDIPLETRQRQ